MLHWSSLYVRNILTYHDMTHHKVGCYLFGLAMDLSVLHSMIIFHFLAVNTIIFLFLLCYFLYKKMFYWSATIAEVVKWITMHCWQIVQADLNQVDGYIWWSMWWLRYTMMIISCTRSRRMHTCVVMML